MMVEEDLSKEIIPENFIMSRSVRKLISIPLNTSYLLNKYLKYIDKQRFGRVVVWAEGDDVFVGMGLSTEKDTVYIKVFDVVQLVNNPRKIYSDLVYIAKSTTLSNYSIETLTDLYNRNDTSDDIFN